MATDRPLAMLVVLTNFGAFSMPADFRGVNDDNYIKSITL